LNSNGIGPVSTALATVNGQLQMLVTNSQSNNVAMLPSVGNGFFNDVAPRTFNTGIDPRQVLGGNFTNPNTLDFVTLNAGSNDLTLVQNFAVNSSGIEFGSGGNGPEDAIAGNFTNNGLTDLVVANNGDGAFALILGDRTGLEIADILHSNLVDHPSA